MADYLTNMALTYLQQRGYPLTAQNLAVMTDYLKQSQSPQFDTTSYVMDGGGLTDRLSLGQPAPAPVTAPAASMPSPPITVTPLPPMAQQEPIPAAHAVQMHSPGVPVPRPAMQAVQSPGQAPVPQAPTATGGNGLDWIGGFLARMFGGGDGGDQQPNRTDALLPALGIPAAAAIGGPGGGPTQYARPALQGTTPALPGPTPQSAALVPDTSLHPEVMPRRGPVIDVPPTDQPSIEQQLYDLFDRTSGGGSVPATRGDTSPTTAPQASGNLDQLTSPPKQIGASQKALPAPQADTSTTQDTSRAEAPTRAGEQTQKPLPEGQDVNIAVDSHRRVRVAKDGTVYDLDTSAQITDTNTLRRLAQALQRRSTRAATTALRFLR